MSRRASLRGAALLGFLAATLWISTGTGRSAGDTPPEDGLAAGHLAGGEGEPAPVGEKTREEVLAASPAWSRSDRAPDADALMRLAALAPGWRLVVVYGHWCSDSSREIPRLLALLDGLGERAPRVRWVAVDEQKEQPAELVRGLSIEQVPTLVVSRGGREIGRIVEKAEPSIEALLLDLLESRGKPAHRQTRPATPSGAVPPRHDSGTPFHDPAEDDP